ncbi:MAG: DUF1549 domain-containing protein [Acidobacteria bacterium]|nr:DUF1549 domain-containing protein [Acidobacteriota bacterium]
MFTILARPTAWLAVGATALGFVLLGRLNAADAEGPAVAQAQATAPAPPAAATPPVDDTLVDYDTQIEPLLSTYCLDCHSDEKRKGGLSLAAYLDVLDGGRSGAAVRPGRGHDSLLVARLNGIRGDQMPLDAVPLTDDEIALVQRWIDQGARRTPSSPPAPAPWEAPLALDAPVVPPVVWSSWTRPLDRLVADYLDAHDEAEPELVDDRTFARRVYLDIWGLLPAPQDLDAFVEDRSADKRDRLVATLLANDANYAAHWASFWNDLLRNEDGVTYFSEENGRRSISTWLQSALSSNLPYDQFVRKLLNPSGSTDPEGFLIGVNWRGVTSAAVTPWMQASQNTAQVFLGVNFKCNACHDSFVNKWSLKDAYGLAAFFSPEGRLQLFRCDVARDEFTEPSFFFPELNRTPPSLSLADRRATAAEIFTDPRNGRLARTLVNRFWERMAGRGIVGNSDEMDGQPWSPAVLDWMASDFVASGYDMRRVIQTIASSRAYQMKAVARTAEMPARNYVFRGPEVRRLTAEQFADAVGTLTGEWSIVAGRGVGAGPAPPPGGGPRTTTDVVSFGFYEREYRAASSSLTRALGRPIRDQVISTRPDDATTLQALELVNGDILTRRLMRGARRLIGELPVEPPSLFNGAVSGRYAQARHFNVDVTGATRLWLLVSDTGSNAPDRVRPVWVDTEFVGPDGAVPLSSLTPVEASGLLPSGPDAARVPVGNPSRLVFDVTGRGFTQLRGRLDLDNPRSDIGSTLNPSLRFFVFSQPPSMASLIPTNPELPFPAPTPATTVGEVVDRVFRTALGRPPGVEERRVSEAAIADPSRPGRPSAEGVADLIWAVMMKPEFQLIY